MRVMVSSLLAILAITLATIISTVSSAPVIGLLKPSSLGWSPSGDWEKAAQLSVDNWNAASPFASGTATLATIDAGCTADSAFNSLTTLTAANPTLTGVIGPLCSQSQAAAMPYASALQLPLVVPAHLADTIGAINGTIITPPPSSSAASYLVSFRPPAAVEARALVGIVRGLGWSSIIVIWLAGGCGEDEATAFVQAAQKNGLAVTPLPIATPLAGSGDALPILLQVPPTAVKKIVMFGCGIDALFVMQAAKTKNLMTNGYQWLFSSSMTAMMKADSSSGELRQISENHIGITLLPNATSSGPITFVNDFFVKYGTYPDNNAYFWWQSTQLLLSAMSAHEAAGYTLNGTRTTNSALMTRLAASTISEGNGTFVSWSYARLRNSAPYAVWNLHCAGDVLVSMTRNGQYISRQPISWPVYNQEIHVGVVINAGTYPMYPQPIIQLLGNFNAKGIVPNMTLVVHVVNSPGGTSSSGFDAIQTLLAGWPDLFCVIGATSETDTNPMVPFSNRYQFSMLTGSVANQDYLDQTRYPYFSRVGPSPTSEVMAMLNVIRSYGWKRIGWCYSLRAYGAQMFQIAASLAASYNITIVASAAIGDDTLNVSPAIGELQTFKDRDVRIIVVATVLAPVARWFKAAAALDMLGEGYVWLGTKWTMDTIAASTSPFYSGAYPTFPNLTPLILNGSNVVGVVYDYNETSPQAVEFKTLYAKSLGVNVSTLSYPYGSAASVFDWVDTANFFLEAFKNFANAGYIFTDRAKFNQFLRNATLPTTVGGSPLELDRTTGDRKVAYFAIGQYRPAISSTGALTNAYFRRGSIRGNSITMTAAVTWMGDALTTPLDAPALQPFVRSQAQSAVVTVLVVLLLICLVVLAFILWKFRDVPHFRGSTPSFDAIILLGAALAVLSSLLYVRDPGSDGDCTFRMWGIGIAGPFTYAPLFVKTYRIERIFSITQLQTLRITDAQLMQGFIALMCIPAALLLVVSVEPSQRSYLQFEQDASGQYLVACCSQSPLYLFGMLAFTACLCAWGAKTAWGVRSVPDNYNESFNTAICLVFLICYLCLVIPLQMIMQTDPNALSLLRSIGILLGIGMSISVLFVPKILRLLPGRHKNIMTFTAAPREETGLRYASNRDSPKAGPRGSRPGGSNHSDITTNPGNGSTLGTVTQGGYAISGAQLSSRPGGNGNGGAMGPAGTPTAAQRGSTASLLSPQQMTSSVSPINAGTPPTAQPAWAATPPSMERNISTAQPSPVSLDSIKTGQSTSGTPILGSARRGGAAPLATLSDGNENVALGRVI